MREEQRVPPEGLDNLWGRETGLEARQVEVAELSRELEARRVEVAELSRGLEARRVEVAELSRELEATNQGIIALDAELEAAREVEARLASIVRSSEDAMLSFSPDLVITAWNAGAEHLFGYSGAEVVGRSLGQLIPPEARGDLEVSLERLREGEQAVRHETWQRRKDGSLVEVAVTLSAIRDPAGLLVGYSGVSRDLTEWRLAEEELATARAREEVFAERDRIARDLHDLVIQRLFACGMSLQGALTLAPPPELARKITAVVDELDATISEIRSTIFALGHGVRSHDSLRAQVLEVVAEAQDVLGFRPRVRFDGPIDLAVSADVVPHLLAVAREALSNVVRHAEASRVDIVVRAAGGEIVLEVADDGRGMEEATRRSGLANLAERAESLGGTFEVVTGDGAGTRLLWRVPAD